MYCIICGAKERLYANLCRECLIEERQLVKISDYVSRIVCQDCGNYRIGMVWVNSVDGAQATVDNNLKVDSIVNTVITEFPEFPDGSNEHDIELRTELLIEDTSIEIPLSFKLRTKFMICDVCSRKKGGYFEAIIQIRGDTRKISDSEIEAITMVLLKATEANQSDKMAFMTKEEKVKGGLDFYMGSAKFSSNIIRVLQNRYGGKVTETTSLFGQKDGKDVYRYTFLLRLPKLRTGDSITDGKGVYYVKSVNKSFAFLKNLATWKKSKVKYDEFKSYKILKENCEMTRAVILHETDDEIQILDPISLKAVVMKKPEGYVSQGKEADVVLVEEDLYLI